MPGSPPWWGSRAVTVIVGGSTPSPGVRPVEMRPASGPSGPGIYWLAPGVSVGERRQPFELEVRGSIPLGSTLESTLSRSRDTSTPLESSARHRFSGVDSTTVAVETERSFTGTRWVRLPQIALSVSRPRSHPGGRRAVAFLQWPNPGSNPGGRHVGLPYRPDKGDRPREWTHFT